MCLCDSSHQLLPSGNFKLKWKGNWQFVCSKMFKRMPRIYWFFVVGLWKWEKLSPNPERLEGGLRVRRLDGVSLSSGGLNHDLRASILLVWSQFGSGKGTRGCTGCLCRTKDFPCIRSSQTPKMKTASPLSHYSPKDRGSERFHYLLETTQLESDRAGLLPGILVRSHP